MNMLKPSGLTKRHILLLLKLQTSEMFGNVEDGEWMAEHASLVCIRVSDNVYIQCNC